MLCCLFNPPDPLRNSYSYLCIHLLLQRDIKKSFGLELRVTSDKLAKAEFDGKAKVLETTFNNLVSDLGEVRARTREQDKKDLMVGNKRRFQTEGRDGDDLLLDAAGLQEETMQSLARSRALVAESEEIGAATITVLQTQREQMNDISNEIDAIDSNLTRAEKLISAFTRRMASDRVLQFFLAVNLVIAIAVAAYAATHKKEIDDKSNDGGGP